MRTYKQQKFKESAEAYKQVLKLNPANKEAKHNLSLANRMLRQQNQQQDQQQNQDQQNKDQQENQDQEQNQDQATARSRKPRTTAKPTGAERREPRAATKSRTTER
jgi:hypothetical protein